MSDQKSGEQSHSEAPSSAPVLAGKFDAQDIEKHKGIACLSYIFLLFLVPLLTEKESKFAQFHAKQGLALFIVWVVVDLVLGVIPVLGWMLMPVANLFFTIVSIIGIIKTLGGEAWEIPGISVITKKINL